VYLFYSLLRDLTMFMLSHVTLLHFTLLYIVQICCFPNFYRLIAILIHILL